MKVAIIDNKTGSIETLLKNRNATKRRNDFNISIFDSGKNFLNEKNYYDIVFMDIEMTGIDGIKTIKRYREYDQRALVILMSNNLELSQEGYLVNAFRFLHKEDKKEKFEEAVKSAMAVVAGRKKIVITISNGKQIILEHSEMICIESYKRGTKIYTKDQVIIATEKISNLVNELSESCFYQTHRAFIINLNDLLSYGKKDIHLKNNITVPLSEKKIKEFHKVYFDWKLQNLNS